MNPLFDRIEEYKFYLDELRLLETGGTGTFDASRVGQRLAMPSPAAAYHWIYRRCRQGLLRRVEYGIYAIDLDSVDRINRIIEAYECKS